MYPSRRPGFLYLHDLRYEGRAILSLGTAVHTSLGRLGVPLLACPAVQYKSNSNASPRPHPSPLPLTWERAASNAPANQSQDVYLPSTPSARQRKRAAPAEPGNGGHARNARRHGQSPWHPAAAALEQHKLPTRAARFRSRTARCSRGRTRSAGPAALRPRQLRSRRDDPSAARQAPVRRWPGAVRPGP